MKKKPAKKLIPRPKAVFKIPANPHDWHPNSQQMEIYDNICDGIAYWREAKRLKTTTLQIRALCQHIDQYLRDRWFRDVREVRVRHHRCLEGLFFRAVESFEASKEPEVVKEIITTAGKDDKGELVKSIKERTVPHAAGNPAFLSVARECLSDIREVWGVNKRVSDDPVDPTKPDDEQRVGGIPKNVLIKTQIQRLQITLEALESSTKPEPK